MVCVCFKGLYSMNIFSQVLTRDFIYLESGHELSSAEKNADF